jgi:hypothetical protein
MRTVQRDQIGVIAFTGQFNGAGSSASGVATGGVPFSFSRAGAGQYTVRFDPSLIPLAVVATSHIGPALPFNAASGVFNVNTTNTAGALTDGIVNFTVTARRMGA